MLIVSRNLQRGASIGIATVCMLVLWSFCLSAAAQAQTSTVIFSIRLPLGHIDDCPAPLDAGCTAVGTDGVRNTIPAGAAGLIFSIDLPPAQFTAVRFAKDETHYTDARIMIGFSSLLFDRRLDPNFTPPAPNYSPAPVTFSLPLNDSDVPTSLQSCNPAAGGSPYCLPIDLPAKAIPHDKNLPAVLAAYHAAYELAEKVIAASENDYDAAAFSLLDESAKGNAKQRSK